MIKLPILFIAFTFLLVTPLTISPQQKKIAALVNKVGSITQLTIQQINAYWAKVKFSGKASPSAKATNSDAVIAKIKTIKNAIGYIPAERITPDVKVVHIIEK